MKIYSGRNRGPLYLLTLAIFSGSLTALVMFSAEPSARLALPDSIWNLTTDDTKLSIGIDSSGQLSLYELSNPATGWNWLSAPAVVPLMSEVFTAAKQKVTVHWIFKDAHLDQRDGQKLSVRFTCASPALELRSEWWARPGRGPIRHAMFIRNASGQAIQFTPQASIDLTLAAPNGNNKVLQAWYVNDEGALWGADPGIAKISGVVKDIVTPTYHQEIAATPGYDWVPMVFLEANGAQGIYLGIEWSHCFIKMNGQTAATGLAVQLQAGHSTNVAIEAPAGCEFEVPPALIGTYRGDIDDAGNSLRKYLFAYSMPAELRTDVTYPKLQWNAFTATGKTHSSQTEPTSWDPVAVKYYPLIKEAAALGFEEMTVDVGWWQGNEPDTDLIDWPEGMKAASEATHQLGLRYVLYWTDSVDTRTPHGRALRAQRIKRLITEYGADTWRSDSTRGAVIRDDYWAVKGFYEMLDTLKKELPRFQWENCSGGGPLKDYGALKRATKIQIHDSISPAITNRRVFYDSSHVLHPIQMQSFLGWHARTLPGQLQGLVYDFRSVALGAFMWWFDSPNPTNGGQAWTEAERQAIARSVNTYKTKLRPLIRTADLYHIFPRPDDKNWDGLQYFDPAAGKGVVFIFKPAEGANSMSIRLRGLDPQKKYRITFDDATNPTMEKLGAELMQGLAVTLKGAPISELVFIEAQ